MADYKWCGCESTSAHYTIGGYRRDLRRECRLAEGLTPVKGRFGLLITAAKN
jgi:hypothetical protein